MQLDVGTTSSYFAVAMVLGACIHAGTRQKWPDIPSTIVLFLAALGVASGAKIIWFGLQIEDVTLGPLADDRPILILGGVASLLFAAKEMVTSWQKAIS